MITHRELPSDKPGSNRLCLTGRDLSAVMDRMDVVMSYPGCSDSVIAAAILVRYALWRRGSQVSPTVDVPLPTERVAASAQKPTSAVFGGWRVTTTTCFIRPLGLAQAAPIQAGSSLCAAFVATRASTWGRAAMSMH